MTPYLQDADVTLYHGDVLDVLRELPDESVDCCVTSPPYLGLREYGNEPTVWGGDPDCKHDFGEAVAVRETTYGGKARWQHVENGRGEHQESRQDREGWLRSEVALGSYCACGAWLGKLGLEPTIGQYVANIVAVFREVRRVLTPTATLWLNVGDSYNAYNGGAGPGSKLSATQTAARPRLLSGFGLQQKELKPKDLMMVPARLALALQEDGWWLRSEIVWFKPNPMPESVRDRPTKAHEMVYLLSKQPRYFFDQEAVREAMAPASKGRYAYSFGGPKSQHLTDTERNGAGSRTHPIGDREPTSGRNIRSVWEIATQPYPEAHFATFPEELARRCIAAGCPEQVCRVCGKARERLVERIAGDRSDSLNPSRVELGHAPAARGHSSHQPGWRKLAPDVAFPSGYTDCGHSDYRAGIVLDPFMGSGTVAYVARKLGRRSIGIDLSADYLDLAARRLQQQSLFALDNGAEGAPRLERQA